MLNHETVNRLRYMKLTGMADSLKEQVDDSAFQEMGFYDRLGLMVDREFTKRQHNKLQRLVSRARFQNTTACVEDIRYDDDRRLDRGFIMELASCNYIPHARNVLVIGPTGAGKSFLAQALGQAACRHMLTTRYVQLPDLLDELKILDPQVAFDEAPAKEVFSPFYPNITPDVEKSSSLARSYPQKG